MRSNGLFSRLTQGHLTGIRITIGMATELEPAAQLPVMGQENPSMIRRKDPGGACDVSG